MRYTCFAMKVIRFCCKGTLYSLCLLSEVVTKLGKHERLLDGNRVHNHGGDPLQFR